MSWLERTCHVKNQWFIDPIHPLQPPIIVDLAVHSVALHPPLLTQTPITLATRGLRQSREYKSYVVLVIC